MTQPAARRVVAGVDGSADGDHAVTWAAREAALRGLPLRVVHVFTWPLVGVPVGPSAYGPPDGGLTNEAKQVVDDAVAHAAAEAPDVDVSGEVVTGTPVPTLVTESRDASVVVVGHRGLGGFSGLLLGSVGVGIAAHAVCPVVVVRPGGTEAGASAGRVVVGVDGSPQSEKAITYAFEEASLRNVGLTAVHTWTVPVSVGPGDMLPLVYDIDTVDREETRLLAELLGGWSATYPDVDVQRRVTRSKAAHALVEESAGAELVVVGSRGRGGFRGMLLGSVSQALIHHAGCPVAIVR